MKKISILFLLTIISLAGFSQSEKYMKAMEAKVLSLDTLRTAEQWKDVTAAFERIGDAEKTQWLPYYYASLGHIIYAYMLGGGQMGAAEKTDPEADAAELQLSKALSLTKENSETFVIKKMIASLRLMGDPMSRYMTYGPQASEALAKAKELDPSNPRVYIQEAQDKYFTPEQFGGSKEEAKKLFEKANEMFATFKPESSIHPNWGRSQVAYFLSLYK